MKVAILFLLIAAATASVYELPVTKAIVLNSDLLHYDVLPSKSYVAYPSKHYVATKHYLPTKRLVTLQSLVHPALSSYHYPAKKYTVHYPSGLYHGPHGLGVYDPKFHDALEHAYYRG